MVMVIVLVIAVRAVHVLVMILIAVREQGLLAFLLRSKCEQLGRVTFFVPLGLGHRFPIDPDSRPGLTGV